MPYPTLPDMRMNYDNDGTLVYAGNMSVGAQTAYSGAQKLQLQRIGEFAVIPLSSHWTWFFFPEAREITAIWCSVFGTGAVMQAPQGSNDTTNGMDGTWETSSLPGGAPVFVNNFSWRDSIKPISFTGPKKTMRLASSPNTDGRTGVLHLYGEAAAGAMAHDLVFINHDDTPGVAFTAPEDFGDQPLGTTVIRQFRVKNTSATKTATNVNIQLNDPDFILSDTGAGGPWVVTVNIASLGPGAESGTIHLRCTTPAPGAPLGPDVARIIVTCDAGFFG